MLKHSQSLKQEQHLSAQMIHALNWLQIPTGDLDHEVEKQRCENPMLEESINNQHLLHKLPTASMVSFHGATPAGVDSELYQYTMDSITHPKTLHEQLEEQLNFMSITEQDKKCIAYLMAQLNSNGYLSFSLEELHNDSLFSLNELSHALKILQDFDPPGIGARDIRECFLLQLKRRGEKDTLTYKIIHDAISNVERNDILGISKMFEVTTDDVYDALDHVRHLSPFPGKTEDTTPTFYAIPEVAFEENEQGEFEVKIIKESVPKIGLSDDYLEILENPKTPEAERQFLREKLISARGLLSALDNRYKTIYKICQTLADQQYDFLKKGEQYLKPLTLRHVADRLGVNESTISRAISGKYAQTPLGVIELKSFFISGFTDHEGEPCSVQSIKQDIQNFIDNENPHKPLSDSSLEALFKEKGVTLARRTIAKYREEIGIPPTHLRKKF